MYCIADLHVFSCTAASVSNKLTYLLTDLPTQRYDSAGCGISYGFAVCVCVSVCLFVTSHYCMETPARVEMACGTQVSVELAYIVF